MNIIEQGVERDRAERESGERLGEQEKSTAADSAEDGGGNAIPPSTTRDASDGAKPSPQPGSSNAPAIDDAFVANLDARMAKAGLEELGWRDRTDLDSVLSDLERLAGASWPKAAALWEKYRPDDQDKPIFIDGDDKDPPAPPAPISLAKQAPDVATTQLPENHSDAAGETSDDKVVLPKSLGKRYLVSENKFYFRDDPNLLAFEDKGKRLATEHNDPLVALSMVELAQAKQWGSIKVKGTEEFRREVWLAASLRDMSVDGYVPKPVDQARLAELLAERKPRQHNAIEQGLDRTKAVKERERHSATQHQEPAGTRQLADGPDNAYRNLTKPQRIAVDTLRAILTERGDATQAVEMAANLASERFQQQRIYVGRLVDHGSAPYENKPNEKLNYFVTLQTINGDQTIWGVDLQRAISNSDIAKGDDLAIVYRGKKRVTVMANEHDAAGKPTGQQVKTPMNRNTWEISKLDKMREEAQSRVRNAAARSERTQPVVKVYDVPARRGVEKIDPAVQREKQSVIDR